MIANNSSGVHTLGYGSTIDYLDTVNVVYSDGNLRTIGGSNTNINYDKTYAYLNMQNIVKLYRLLSLRSNMELIDKGYPKVKRIHVVIVLMK